MPSFGEVESKAIDTHPNRGTSRGKNDRLTAHISKAELPRNPEGPGFLKNEWGKSLCDVTFRVDVTGKEYLRRYAINFGFNQKKQIYADFANLIEAAVGIKCGDRHQRDLGTEDLEGQEVQIVVAPVQKGEKTYYNVMEVYPPEHAMKRQAKEAEEEDDFEEVPF